MNILKVLDTLQRDTDCLFSKHTFGRHIQRFPSDKYFWMNEWISFYEKIYYQWNNRKPKRKTLVRKPATHTEGKRKTWILLTACLSYSFIIEKYLYPSFLLPWNFVESTCILKQHNPIGDSSSREDYFQPFVIWPLLNTKTFVKTSSKRKKIEFFFWKNSFSV